MNKILIVVIAGLILAGGYGVAKYALNAQQASEPASRESGLAASLVRDHSPRAGNADARVTIVEFFDPACETCRAFHPIVKSIMRDHPGQVNLVMRFLPLHHGSDQVVRVLEAARLQGKYWEALEAGYAAQRHWAINHQAHPDLFWQSIAGVGLDAKTTSDLMRSEEVAVNIQQDIDDARSLGVDKTPGFFVNGRPLVTFGERQLRQLVLDELSRQYTR